MEDQVNAKDASTSFLEALMITLLYLRSFFRIATQTYLLVDWEYSTIYKESKDDHTHAFLNNYDH